MGVVEAEAASGQPEADNTGQAHEMSLEDAISAAIAASRGEKDQQPDPEPKPDKAEGKEPDAGEVAKAGEGRNSEDARKPEDAQDGKDGGEAVKKDDAPAFEAPAHWSEAHRKAFAELDAKSQTIVRDLTKAAQAHLTRTSQELGDKAKYADAIRTVIDDQTRQALALSGANELQYFAYLHGLQQQSKTDPKRFGRQVVESLGLQPEDLFPQIRQQQPAQQAQPGEQDLAALLADPRVNSLEAKLAQLEGQWNQRLQADQYEHQRRHAHYVQSLEHAVNQFRGTLDDSGQLLYPHFDSVRQHMGALMKSDPDLAVMADGPERMKAAYDMAVWARPDLRQSLLEAEASKRAAALEKAKEVARAKAVTSVKPAAAVATAAAKPKDLDSIIRENMGSRGFGA